LQQSVSCLSSISSLGRKIVPHIVPVPTKLAAVKAFIDENRERFERDLSSVQELVATSLAELNVYKIYGRSDKQGGSKLKQNQKILLKFNRYFTDRKETQGSLWSVPDIIGFTIVVAYPSDITSVCKVLDELIEREKLANAGTSGVASPRTASEAREEEDEQRAKAIIVTRFGRAIISDGYFACHYNVRNKGMAPQRPICEIQIKTVLHDAWGAKSHDLTYKPSGRTSQDLIDSFNLLGDTLAKIDQQSDLVRRSIERNAQVRESKKRRVQEAVIANAAAGDAAGNDELKAIVDKIKTLDPNSTSNTDHDELIDKLVSLFKTNERAVCVALCYVSTRLKSATAAEYAREAIDAWLEEQNNRLSKIFIRSISALANYSMGDLAGAIEAAEQANEWIEQVDMNTLNDDEQARLNRMANANLTNLAYYHAERIGSHEGNLAGSSKAAIDCLRQAGIYRHHLGLLPAGLDSSDEEIEAALNHPKLGWAAFSTLDSEVFVKIQSADNVDDVRAALRRLDFLHRERPSYISQTGILLRDYNDYCARVRLAELEAR
jgi:ppGpp synthetase/RelA/SpoT-type nucleotidyltranferase